MKNHVKPFNLKSLLSEEYNELARKCIPLEPNSILNQDESIFLTHYLDETWEDPRNSILVACQKANSIFCHYYCMYTIQNTMNSDKGMKEV